MGQIELATNNLDSAIMHFKMASNISISIFEDLAKRRSPFAEKLIPDLINRFLLFS